MDPRPNVVYYTTLGLLTTKLDELLQAWAKLAWSGPGVRDEDYIFPTNTDQL